MHDIYAYGVIAASTVLELEDPYPAEGGYAEIRNVHEAFGGEAAGGAYVLARLGVPTKLAGSLLGTDPGADRAMALLADAGVDCSVIEQVDGAGVTEVVVSSGAERSVLAGYGAMLADRSWSMPARTDVSASRMVCLDSFFGVDSESVAGWCLEDDVPYVTIDAPPDSVVTEGAASIVVSREYAAFNFGDFDALELLDAYAHRCRGLAILTQGDGPMLYQRGSGPVGRLPAFDVSVTDTMGAGDSFRAGVAYALLRGADDDEVVRTAAGVAALVCGSAPGVLHSPTEAELASFLAGRRANES